MTKQEKATEQKTLWRSDPERYARCSQPFETSEAARAAVEAFFADISALREKHLLSDIEIVIKDSYGKGEDASSFLSSAHFGNVLEREGMLAYAFGHAQQDRKALVEKLLTAKGVKAFND